MIQFSKKTTGSSLADTLGTGRSRGAESERPADDVAEEVVEGAGESESDAQELEDGRVDVDEECVLGSEYFTEEFDARDDIRDLARLVEEDVEPEDCELDLSNLATSREGLSDPVKLYLTEIGRFPLLSREEEFQIATDISSWGNRLRDALFKSDFVARKAVSVIRSLLDSKVDPDASPDDEIERLDTLFLFKRDGSDGKGGLRGTRERLAANVATIERLLERIQDTVPLICDTSRSPEVRFEHALLVFRARSKIATLLHETGMRRSLLKELEAEFLSAAHDLSSSLSDKPYLEIFGESKSRLERRVVKVQMCDERYEGARTKLYQHNLRLVVSNAKKWATGATDLLEQIQAGNEGLGVAVDGFDVERGFKFSTYATAWIKQRQRRNQFESGQSIQRKVSSQTLVNKLYRAQNEFAGKYGRDGDEYELAEYTGMPLEHVQRGLRLMRPALSLDMQFGTRDGGDGMTFGETLAAREEEHCASRLDREQLRQLTHHHSKILNFRESLIVRLRYGMFSDEEHEKYSRDYGVNTRDTLTLEQVGGIFKITRERVRQIESKALKKLEDALVRQSGWA